MRSTNFKLNSSPSGGRKWPFLLVLLVLAAGVSGGLYVYVKKQNQEQARIEQKARDEAQIQSSKDYDAKNASSDKNGASTGATSTTSNEIPTSDSIAITVDSVVQADRQINASAVVTGATTSGICVFSFTTPDAKPVVKQTSSANNACSVSISEVEFDKLGIWNLNVTFFINDTKAEVNQNVTIS